LIGVSIDAFTSGFRTVYERPAPRQPRVSFGVAPNLKGVGARVSF
jgi:hypothetical protein